MRTCIHAVFDAGDPFGDVYAKISPCVPGSASVPVVPHIVRAAESTGPDMRAELGIPEDATVFVRTQRGSNPRALATHAPLMSTLCSSLLAPRFSTICSDTNPLLERRVWKGPLRRI